MHSAYLAQTSVVLIRGSASTVLKLEQARSIKTSDIKSTKHFEFLFPIDDKMCTTLVTIDEIEFDKDIQTGSSQR